MQIFALQGEQADKTKQGIEDIADILVGKLDEQLAGANTKISLRFSQDIPVIPHEGISHSIHSLHFLKLLQRSLL